MAATRKGAGRDDAPVHIPPEWTFLSAFSVSPSQQQGDQCLETLYTCLQVDNEQFAKFLLSILKLKFDKQE